jgi:hypothetical protein
VQAKLGFIVACSMSRSPFHPAFVPHLSRERPGDVKKRQEQLEHRVRR